MSKVIVRTERWNVQGEPVIKAVVRTEDGKFVGATNQTQVAPQTLVIVGK
jgi:flagellar biosynthesis protein FlhB